MRLSRLLCPSLFVAVPVAAAMGPTSSAHAAITGAERNAVAIDAFMAGATLSAVEVAAIVAEDSADRRSNPALAARNDREAAAFLARLRRRSPQLQAQDRQQLMNNLYAAPHGFADPRQKAIIARHNPVLVVSTTSQVLTLRSVAGLLSQMQQMAAFQGRPPLDPALIRRTAAEMPAQFRAANATGQQYMAYAEPDAIMLRAVLARQSPAERARYRRAASVGSVTPAMLRQAAMGTLRIAARARSGRPSRGSMNAYYRALGNLNFSPFIPHR